MTTQEDFADFPPDNVHRVLARNFAPGSYFHDRIYERARIGRDRYNSYLDENCTLQSGDKPSLETLIPEIIDELIDALAYLELAKRYAKDDAMKRDMNGIGMVIACYADRINQLSSL